MKPVLYHYWRSSASWRVRYGLAVKKIAVDMVAVDLLQGQEKNADYLARNPSGYVPCLIVDGRALGESLSILEWLEETHPSPSFYTGDSFMRAKIRQLAETVNSGIQPLQNLDVSRFHSADKEEQGRWMRHWMSRGLGVYETLLSGIDRKGCRFSVSDSPTLADLCLIPQVYSALRNNIDMAAYPQCRAIYEHALSTPEGQASQPDAVKPV